MAFEVPSISRMGSSGGFGACICIRNGLKDCAVASVDVLKNVAFCKLHKALWPPANRGCYGTLFLSRL